MVQRLRQRAFNPLTGVQLSYAPQKKVMNIILSVFSFLIGISLGSFANVCIYRLPEGKSIAWPGSFCPRCKHKILWYDNIPLLSFLFLKGKCRFCHEKISPRYFIVELLTGILVLILFLKFNLSLKFLIYLVFILALIIVSFIDIENFLIPDCIVYPGIVLGLLLSFLYPGLQSQGFSHLLALKTSFLGVLLGGGSLLLIGYLGGLIFKKEAMGGGDVKLLAMIGAFLGYKSVFLTIFFSSLVGAIISLVLIALKLKKRTDYIPYGPYLALAAIISIFWKGHYFVGFLID